MWVMNGESYAILRDLQCLPFSSSPSVATRMQSIVPIVPLEVVSLSLDLVCGIADTIGISSWNRTKMRATIRRILLSGVMS